MASDKAMPSTASVMTFPKAPGLRPTASEAFMPTSPTPIAEPNPANPTWMLPLICANTGVNIYASFLSLYQQLPRLNTVEPLKSFESMLFLRVLLLVRANQCREHGRQEHKHKGLNQPDQHFQKVKWHRKQHAEDGLGPCRMLNGV